MSNRLGRKEQCPCGSGKKYKNCCWDKEFHWIKNPDGTISKEIPMSDWLQQEFDNYRDKFREKHGRDIEPSENNFPDFNLVHVEADMILGLKQANVPPQLLYAYEKTGRLVWDGNKNKLSDIELKEWDDAIDEYFRLYPEEHVED